MLKEKKGFIAVETIITAGLMIALASYGLENYLAIAYDVSDHANALVNSVNMIKVDDV